MATIQNTEWKKQGRSRGRRSGNMKKIIRNYNKRLGHNPSTGKAIDIPSDRGSLSIQQQLTVQIENAIYNAWPWNR